MWNILIIILCILIIIGLIALIWTNNSDNYNTDNNIYT